MCTFVSSLVARLSLKNSENFKCTPVLPQKGIVWNWNFFSLQLSQSHTNNKIIVTQVKAQYVCLVWVVSALFSQKKEWGSAWLCSLLALKPEVLNVCIMCVGFYCPTTQNDHFMTMQSSEGSSSVPKPNYYTRGWDKIHLSLRRFPTYRIFSLLWPAHLFNWGQRYGQLAAMSSSASFLQKGKLQSTIIYNIYY